MTLSDFDVKISRQGSIIIIEDNLASATFFPRNKDKTFNAVIHKCASLDKSFVTGSKELKFLEQNIESQLTEIYKQYEKERAEKLAAASDHGNGKVETKKEVEKIELTKNLTKEITFKDVGKILSTSIKKDDSSKLITFCGMLLAQTENDQLNMGFQAESSAGKSYIPIEVGVYFPQDEVITIASASPTAFFHEEGVWDKEKRAIIVNLEGKILIFLDQPHFQLLEKLRPLLSHDKKELQYKITDKSQRKGQRTKNVILRGFPSVCFCSTKQDPDEQEKTRLILLSPSTDQDKLKESIRLMSMRKGNPEQYEKEIELDPRRQFLINRINAIRQKGVRQVIILNHERAVYARFLKRHPYLLARHQRDYPRIIGLIKAHALLNCFNRREITNGNVVIVANQQDINAGFELYEQIEESNELGLSPYIYRVYFEVIKPYLNPEIGLSRKDIRSAYYRVFHRTLPNKFEDSVLLQLEAAGLIEQVPDPEDRRKQLIYSVNKLPLEKNYIPFDSGVKHKSITSYPTVKGNISSSKNGLSNSSKKNALEEFFGSDKK